jgi:M6 family metalloprotease-like protein
LTVRLRHLLGPLLFPALLLVLTETASQAAVPPVPNKKGPLAPLPGERVQARKLNRAAAFPGRANAPLQTAQTVNVLAIRASFSDTPIESTAAYYDRLLLFMSQYWSQMSNGMITLNVTLCDSVFTLPHPLAYYGDDAAFQERLVYLVRDVVGAADSTVDFSPYQSLVIFHAGVGQEADVNDNSRDAIWSAFVTKEDMAEILGGVPGQAGIVTNDEISPGNYFVVKEAVELPESETQDGYVFGMTGVVCHEFGHQVGTLRGLASFPDLYDTTPDEGGYSHGLGAWDLMAEGVWNYNGFVPAGLSAWSKYWLGFIFPFGGGMVRVTGDASLSLAQLERPIGSIPQAIQIPLTQSEYFLVENRRRDLNDNGKFDFDDVNGDGHFDFYTDSYAGAEWDFYLPGDTTGAGSGALVYHVDDSKIEAGLPTNTVEGDSQRKGIDVEEAGGVQDLDGSPGATPPGTGDDAFRDGWYNQFTPETNPSSNAYPNVPTGVALRDISAADSIMAMSLTIGGTKAGWPKLIAGKARGIPTVAADLDGDGKLELIVPIQRLNNTGALYAFRADGTNFLGGGASPVPFATLPLTAPSSSPCVGSIDGDPAPEIVFAALNGSIYAYHTDGTEVMDGDKDPTTTGVLVSAPLGASGTHAQPVLADLNGDGRMEIIMGGTAAATSLGGSTLTVASLAGDSLSVFRLPMGGSTEGPPAVADLDGDGLPEVIVSNVSVPAFTGLDNSASGLSIANWEILNDPDLAQCCQSQDAWIFYLIESGGPYSAPVLADLNRDGKFEAVLADAKGAYHAIQFHIEPHAPFDPPHDPSRPEDSYVKTSELPGWPVSLPGGGRTSEVSLADLEGDGYPEILHTGQNVLVSAFHYNGAIRSGYPVDAAAPYAPSDSAGFWPPLVADVDGDGLQDVIPILPDGRRPAYTPTGKPIAGFVGLGSTGAGPPPMLIDLDKDGSAEWVEFHDAGPSQAEVIVRSTPWAVRASSLTWTQYRNSATRNTVVPAGAGGAPPGPPILSAVYGYPNPSRGGATTIHYRLSAPASAVRVTIIDPTGEIVAEPGISAADLAGSAEHTVSWRHGSAASGVYRCRVEIQSIHGTEVQFAGLAIIK